MKKKKKMIDKENENIQVLMRVRPLSGKEKTQGATSCLNYSEDTSNTIQIDSKPDPKTFVFDYVAGQNIGQDEIFNIIGKPLTISCFEG